MRITGSPVLLVLATAACAPAPKADAAADSTASVPAAAPIIALDVCVNAALAAKAGTIVKLEGKTEGADGIYEFDIRSPDGTQWDVECTVASGEITEIEEELTAEQFKAKGATLSEADARKAALAAHAGEIVEVEYEVEPNGDLSYEFDVRGADGSEQKIEIDAKTGAVVEHNAELYQIGAE
jgi:uncharacterized membrane protein YkoI